MKNRKGFTLVEIVAAIAIMAIIGLIAAPAVIKKFNSSRIQAMAIQENKLVEAGDILLDDYCKDAIDYDKKRKCKFYYQELALSDEDKTNYSDIIKDNKIYKYICVSDIKDLDYYSEELVYSGTPCQGVVIYEIDKKSNMTSDSYSYVKCEDAYKTQDKNVKIEELFKGCFDGSSATNREETYTVTVKHVENDLGGMEISPRKTHTVKESELLDGDDDVLFEIETILHTRNGNTYKPVLKVGGENIKYKERKVNNKTVYDITDLPSKNLTINIVYTVEKHAIVSNFYRFVPGKDENEKSHNGVKMTGIEEQKIIGYTFETMKVDFPETLDQTIGGKTEKYSLVEVWVEDSKKTLPFDGNVEVTQEDTFVDFVYQQDEFNVTYNNKGGSGCDKGRIKYNKKYKESTYCTPTKTGYTFSGWSLTDGGEVLDKEKVNLDYHDITLYAKYEPKTYIITYHIGNASSTVGATAVATSTCKYNETCVLTDFSTFSTPFPYSYQDEQATLNTTKHGNYGWKFYGWTTDKDATPNASNKIDINYSNKKSFTYNIASNLSLYAIGKRNMHFNGGVAPVKSYAEPVQYWNPYGITNSYLTKVSIPNEVNIDTWTFIGYKCGNSTANSSVTFDAGLAGTEYKIPYNTWPYTRSVYKRTLSLEYKPNTGTGTMSNQTDTQYYNSGYGKNNTNYGANETNHTFTLAYNGFTKSGYEFVEWKEDSTSGTSRAAGSSFSFSPSVNKTNKKIFYARWKQNNTVLNSYKCANKTVGSAPYVMEYSGNCQVIDDGNGKWRVKYLTTGDLIFTRGFQFDVFLVGGGGSGANYGVHSGGGGGGYTTSENGKTITANESYHISIGKGGIGGSTNGNSGDSTTAFGLTAAGGGGGGGGGYMVGPLKGGNGGSGGGAGSAAGHAEQSPSTPGLGGTDGHGGKGSFTGTGQGTTTREFEETTGALYAKGGDGANSGGTIAAGGANTGNGGAGGGYNGGSGVVVIRQSNTNPYFTYTGNYEIVDNNGNQINDLSGDWKIRFLTEGKLIFKNFGSATNGFDVFLVGGGGGGTSYGVHCGGGGGGYTTTKKEMSLLLNHEYDIYIGPGGSGGGTTAESGGETTAFGLSAAGGEGAGKGGYMVGSLKGGNGGSGGGAGSAAGHEEQSPSTPGLGGTNGNGGRGSFPGTGQGSTTREFGESTGILYAEGGDGHSSGGNMRNGDVNTGNGGAGGSFSGGSGIVVIRPSKPNPYFSYTGTYEIVDDSGNKKSDLTGNWKIKFLSSGTLTFKNLGNASNGIDVFCVGGGGGTSFYGNHNGGGGGGYTKTKRNVSVEKSKNYEIIVGNGGSSGSTSGGNGGSSSAFGLTASGGQGGGNGGYMIGSLKGGNGGSGGGAGVAAGHEEQSASTPGLGGTNGNGGAGSFPGTGQGSTTREFGENSGKLYSKGGDGSTVSGGSFTHGGLNTGDGGAGGAYSGGSGIVIIRNKR